ncbi:MAG: carotenoid biosynthesis protein [Treponema sp.]|nr:carotenoid biosynthesis protein [Treponema sp.]
MDFNGQMESPSEQPQNLHERAVRKENFVIGLLGALFFIGLWGHLFPITRPFMLLLTPYLLLMCGGLVFILALREEGAGLLLLALPTFLVTFTLEALGVATGAIFGAYRYGPVLGKHFFNVPPIIGFNWVLVVLGFSRLVWSRFCIRYAPLGAFVTALLCVLFDYIMEPVAVALNYWTWTGGTIPLKNYAAWFLISYIFALPTWYLKETLKAKALQGYILIQAGFFILLRFGLAFVR